MLYRLSYHGRRFIPLLYFQTEFDNEGESLISRLEEFPNLVVVPGESTKEDEELDAALKMAHIEMYKSKLRDRERRKRVARDYQLISEN